jgi:hypothetical protein
MESFFDTSTGVAVRSIQVPEGRSKILRLKKPGPGVQVTFASNDPTIANVFVVRALSHSKESYIDNYDGDAVLRDSMAVEDRGSLLLQIVAIKPGEVEVTARFTGKPVYYDPYGLSVTVDVTGNAKHFNIQIGHPVPFKTLWANHPYAKDPTVGKLCGEAWLAGECMVRFCTMMKDSGVNLAWLNGRRWCGRGPGHQHHFIDPYDFQRVRTDRDAYVWQHSSLEPEPMPGMAALSFIKFRWKGVILFWNYFNTTKGHDMSGGHIDLWNGYLMGNSLVRHSEAAFYRSSKIVFWPLESYVH